MTTKFSSFVTGVEKPHLYAHEFMEEPTTGPDRLVIGARGNHVDLLRQLADCLEPDYWLLYVLTVSSADRAPGRYQSPDLEAVTMQSFLAEFTDFFEGDGRHSVWVGTQDHGGLLVYDRHDVIYAYGPLDTYREVLAVEGLREVLTLDIPGPHAHHYNHECFAGTEDELFRRFDWQWFELQEGDDD
ncbi:MAG: hypothetical protein ACYTHK_06835 [Planctomycetota bacterium]|jgi:hypothetical protein